MEKNIKKYISNVKNVNILLENINKDIESLNRKLELLKDVNNVRLDEKSELLKNIIENKVQIGGGVSENLKMNDELDSKIKKLQEKVSNIREKTLTLQQITKENLQKTSDNMRNIIQLTESVDSIMGDPSVTETITQSIKNINPKHYLNFVETNNFNRQLFIEDDKVQTNNFNRELLIEDDKPKKISYLDPDKKKKLIIY